MLTTLRNLFVARTASIGNNQTDIARSIPFLPMRIGSVQTGKEGEVGMSKNYDWAVVVTCQGQPFYYKHRNLVSALFAYAWHYMKKRKYGTMNFTLRQSFYGEKLK